MLNLKNKNMAYSFLAFVIILSVVIVASFLSKGSPDMAASSGILRVGYIGPLSGPSAVLGMDAIKAIEIAAEEANANGKKVEIVAEDDQYLTNKTLSAYEKLVNIDKVDILLISTYGGVYAVADRAKQDGMVVIDPLDCNTELARLNENIFCLATETESIGTSLAEYLVKNNKKKAAVMYSTKDNFMAIVKNSFEKIYKNGDNQFLVENYNYDDQDFKTQLLKIKEFNPDALVILGHDEQGTIMNQARELGIKAQFLTTGTITSPSAQEAAKGNVEGTIFAYYDVNSENEIASDFNSKFVAKVGRPAILPLTTYPAYDAINILTHNVLPELSLAGDRKQTAEKIKKVLSNIKDIDGSTGKITIDSDGAAKIKETVYKLVKGLPEKIN